MADLECVACGSTGRRRLFSKQGYAFVRCRGCGLVRLDPLPEPAALAAIYDDSYRDGLYARFARADDVRSGTARARLAAVRQQVPRGAWLDVGCSTGQFVAVGRAAGIDVEGIEQSAAAVDAAHAAGLPVTRAAIESFEPSRRYACITAFDLLEHLLDPGTALDRLRGWLVPEGRLALTVPNVASMPARLMGRHWYYYAPPVHVYYFERATITRLLARHGLVPVQLVAARKVLTVDYAATMLTDFNPRLARGLGLVCRVLPATLRRRPWEIPIGELLVIAGSWDADR